MAGKRERPTPTGILTETYRNIVSRPIAAITTAIFSAAAALAAATVVLAAVSFLSSTLESQIARGSAVFVVTTSTPKSILATRCHQLLAVDGVRSAGAVIGSRTVTYTRAPDNQISVMTVTPGFPLVAFPQQNRSEAGGLSVGSDAAKNLGVTTGSQLGERVESQFGRVTFIQGDSPERIPGTSRSVLEPVAPIGNVSECYVEAEYDQKISIETLLATWFDPNLSWNVVPILPASQLDMDVTASLRQLPVVLIGGVAGAVAVTFNSLMWWSRRQEFALYALLGFRPSHLVAMISLEYLALALMPSMVAMYLASRWLPVDEFLSGFEVFAMAGMGAFWLVAITAPAFGWIVVRSRGISIAIKGG